MVVILLILIVLVLLFGAGAVKGWLRGLALHVVGGGILVALFVTLKLWLGGDGVRTVLWIVVGLCIVMAIAKAVWLADEKQVARDNSPAARAARQRATDEAWARWEEENRKPEVKLSNHRPTKVEKKRRRTAYRRSLGATTNE